MFRLHRRVRIACEPSSWNATSDAKSPQKTRRIPGTFFSTTNLKNKEYCSESHDARHEEANKRAQNMLSGKDLEEFDLAFRIVDDLDELKAKYFEELVLMTELRKPQ